MLNGENGNIMLEFLFASLDEEYLLNGIYFLRKEFAPKGANSFLNKLSPFQRGGRKENGRVAFLGKKCTGTLKKSYRVKQRLQSVGIAAHADMSLPSEFNAVPIMLKAYLSYRLEQITFRYTRGQVSVNKPISVQLNYFDVSFKIYYVRLKYIDSIGQVVKLLILRPASLYCTFKPGHVGSLER